jgi:anti-sigma factor RsiW
MATSCEDISARMMELVYGELPDADRASFEAHIAGCARCRAERDAFDGTRAMARGALDEPVPARAHAAILRAASEHLAATRAAAKAAATSAPATPRMSFWDWIRTRWTLPTLATVGAVAVVLLAGKVFLDPKKVHERGEQVLAPETAGPAVTASPAPTPRRGSADTPREAAAPQPTSAPMAEDRSELKKESAGGKSSRKAAKFAARVEKDTPGPVAGSGRAGGGSGSGMGAIAERRQFAPPPPPKVEKPAPASDEASAALADADKGLRPGKGKGSVDDLLAGAKAGGASRSAASEPRPAEARSAAAPAASAPMAPPPSAPAVAAEAPAAYAKKAKRERASELKEAEGQTAATPIAGSRADDKPTANASRVGGGPPEALIARADRFYAEGRWSEAAAAYRELLRLDPNNAVAGRWRQRLTVAQAQAEVAAREAAAAREAPASAAPAKASESDRARSK